VAFISEFSNPLGLSSGMVFLGWVFMLIPFAIAFGFYIVIHMKIRRQQMSLSHIKEEFEENEGPKENKEVNE